MKKFVYRYRINELIIHKMINHCVWYCWVATTKTVTSIFFLNSLFSGEDYSLCSPTVLSFLVFCSLPLIQLIGAFDKTPSQITSSCLTVPWGKVDDILHLLSITISSEIKAILLLVMVDSLVFLDSDEISSSATALNYFHIMYQLIYLSFVQSWVFC